MGKIIMTEGTGIPHRTFEDEFLTHRPCSEWWYCTGYLQDAQGRLFGYQFTLAKVKICGIRFHILITSVTDFETKKHYNTQTPIFFHRDITTTGQTLACGSKTVLTLAPNEFSSMGRMTLHMESSDFCLDVEMQATKGAVWQCADGVVQMGIPDDEKERTYYYSFTNLATTGTLMLNGQAHEHLSGKTWFDRQGGPYSLTDPRCNWEWFSLRFFDESEAMLFAFPQSNSYDGTFIATDGTYRRMADYQLAATKVITYQGMKFSSGWDLTMNGKKYTLTPKAEGMFNVFFFELLADIVDEDGQSVGYCFVELLPGVRNKNSVLDAFKKK